MSIAGNIYGVVLNDREELTSLSADFAKPPYQAPPEAPVVYMKPSAATVGFPGVPAGTKHLLGSPTVALLLSRDASRVTEVDADRHIGAACLALDVSLPEENYYRPSVARRCRPGFLPLGNFVAPVIPDAIRTYADGELVHSWSLDRLVRPWARLISDLSGFMTLRAGDLLLVGLPGDAPQFRSGQKISIEADGMPPLKFALEEEG